MTHTQVVNLLTFNTIMLNEKIIMPDYIIEKFNAWIGNVDNLVIRTPIEEEILDKDLYLFDYFTQRGGYTEDNWKIFGGLNNLSIDYQKSFLLSLKEKMIIYYLKSFRTYEDVFSNYNKYIGDLGLISDKEALHVHPITKKFVQDDIPNHLRIINLYKLLY